MPRGPAPSPNARRRNAPTIPTTLLPKAGRKGRAPALPATYTLNAAGRAWWNWAWKLPQAEQWDRGALYAIARRAQLEDDLVALDEADSFSLEDHLGALADKLTDAKAVRDTGKAIDFLIGRLKGLAGSRVSVLKEMRELDNRLGLNPKAMIDLRWSVDETEPKSSKGKGRKRAKRDDRLD